MVPEKYWVMILGNLGIVYTRLLCMSVWQIMVIFNLVDSLIAKAPNENHRKNVPLYGILACVV